MKSLRSLVNLVLSREVFIKIPLNYDINSVRPGN